MKRVGICVGTLSLLNTTALAQSPVSARMSMSGSCSNCDLSNRVMPSMSLQGSNFSNSDFSRSNLSGGRFSRANLRGASFHKAYLMRVKGQRINLRDANLRGATLIEAELINSNISHADLRGADLSNGIFDKTRFIRSFFKGAEAIGASFIEADFTKANLKNSDFTEANFNKAIFIKTKFGDAILEEASFKGANFSSAILTDVQGLTQEQLSLACGNQETQLPQGLSIQKCVFEEPEEHSLDAIAAEQTHSALSPPPALTPSQYGRSVLKFVSVHGSNTVSQHEQALEIANHQLEQALRSIPIDNPARKNIAKAQRYMKHAQQQAKSHANSHLKPPSQLVAKTRE